MCEPNPSDLPRPVTRRSVLTAATVLAGATAATTAAGSPASAAAMPPAVGWADSDNVHHVDSTEPIPGFGHPPVPPPLVITGANLLEPATGAVIEDAVLVLAGGKVIAAGSGTATRDARAKVTPAAQVIDVAGATVLPGLLDVHVHLNALADAAGVLRAGATTARSGSSNFYQDVALRALSRWSPTSAPRLRAAGVFVTPDLGDTILADPRLAPLSTLPDGVRSSTALRYLTNVNLARGVDVIKTRSNERAGVPDQDPLEQVYDRRQIRVVVDAAHRRGASVLCHSYSAEGCADAVAAGVASLEHGVFVTEQTLDLMARRGTFFTPTLSAIASLAESPNPILAERGRRFLPVLQRAVLAAAQHGVSVAAGTDSFGTPVRPIGAEVEQLVAAGLPTLDALRAATTRAARLLKLQGTAGRLTPGYSADVLAVDGNPVDDIAALRRIQLVIARGAVARNDLPAA